MQKKAQFMYNLRSEKSKKLSSAGLCSQGALMGCAVANKQLVTVLCGGYISSSTSSKEVLQFDWLTWSKLPSMNVARCGGAAVFHNKKLYVFGGETTPVSRATTFKKGETNRRGSMLTETFEIFEAEKGWKIVEFNPKLRSYGAAVAYQNQILLIGGYEPSNSSFRSCQAWKVSKKACNEVLYYPISDSWEESIQMRYARAEFGCALLVSRIYVVGGFFRDNKPLESVEYRNLNNKDKIWTVLKRLVAVDSGIFCLLGKKMYTVFHGKIHSI